MSFSFSKSENYELYFHDPTIKGILNTSRNIQTHNCHVISPITIPDTFPKLTFSGVGSNTSNGGGSSNGNSNSY